MLATSAIQGMLPSLDDMVGAAVMDRRRRQPVQARMIVNVVVPAEEVAAERLGILDTAETFGETRPVLQRFEPVYFILNRPLRLTDVMGLNGSCGSAK